MDFTSASLDPQSTTLLRVITDPVLSDTPTFTMSGLGNPIVFNWVRLADQSLLLLVLGATPKTLTAITISDGAYEETIAYEVPADPLSPGKKVLEAITYAFGKQVQFTAGVPASLLRADVGPFDTVLYVDSTLGFPPRGWLRLGELVLEYTSRTAQSFTLRQASLVYPKVRKGTAVYSEVTLITPDGAGFGTESL
jgi:hypothetical protein